MPNFLTAVKSSITLPGLGSVTVYPALRAAHFSSETNSYICEIDYYTSKTQPLPIQTSTYNVALSSDQKTNFQNIFAKALTTAGTLVVDPPTNNTNGGDNVLAIASAARSSINVSSSGLTDPLDEIAASLTLLLPLCLNSSATNQINSALSWVASGKSNALSAANTAKAFALNGTQISVYISLWRAVNV